MYPVSRSSSFDKFYDLEEILGLDNILEEGMESPSSQNNSLIPPTISYSEVEQEESDESSQEVEESPEIIPKKRGRPFGTTKIRKRIRYANDSATLVDLQNKTDRQLKIFINKNEHCSTSEKLNKVKQARRLLKNRESARSYRKNKKEQEMLQGKTIEKLSAKVQELENENERLMVEVENQAWKIEQLKQQVQLLQPFNLEWLGS